MASHEPPPLIDTHCHLDHCLARGFALDQLEERSRAAGVECLVLPGTSPATWARSLEVAAQVSSLDVSVALGIHPQAVRDLTDDEIDEALDALPGLVDEHEVVAIGEIGVDHRWDRDDAARARQHRVFVRQLEIAAVAGLPVLVHCLGAYGRTVELFERAPSVRGIMHSYSGSAEMVAVFSQFGLAFSFSGAVTWPRARKITTACRAVPDELLLVETDAPYQPPEQAMGRDGTKRPSEPADTRHVVETIAAIRDSSYEAVAALTTANARRLLGLVS